MNDSGERQVPSEFPTPLWLAPDYLTEMFREDPEVAIELLQLFLEDAEERLLHLQQCLLVPDAKAFGAISHTLKGSARQLGALRMAEIAEAVETGASRRDWRAVGNCMASLQLTFGLLRDEVRGQICDITKQNHGLVP